MDQQELVFHLEDFNGPLDLLLALIQKNKKSIYEIEILSLIDQYLAVVGQPGPDRMDTTSEFIAMAAHLVQMKSFLLLPKSEEAERLREELTGLLVEYSACKQVAARLREMAQGVYIAVRQPAEVELDTDYKGQHELRELTDAYRAMMGRSKARRMPSRERFDDIVAAPVVSVGSRVVHVLRGLVTGKAKSLGDLFRRGAPRSETVATFLAVLELIRGRRVTIDDTEQLALNTQRIRRKTGEEG